MMPANLRTERLQLEYQLLEKLLSESDLIKLKKDGDPPENYFIIFHGRGLMLQGEEVVETNYHEAIINLGMDWPQRSPLILWRTPIFHPNIKAPYVCLLGHPYSASTHLDQICDTLWDMLTFKTYNINSPLDKQAAQWAREHPERFPVDERQLRNQSIVIRVKNVIKKDNS